MPEAVIVRLLKGNALLSSRLGGGTKKFPRWDKLNELVHSGTDRPFPRSGPSRSDQLQILWASSAFLVQQRVAYVL
jgi:hypothetical protein